MVTYQFDLSKEDHDRLYAIKEDWGKNYLTGSEFAALLLSTYLHQIHPQRVEKE